MLVVVESVSTRLLLLDLVDAFQGRRTCHHDSRPIGHGCDGRSQLLLLLMYAASTILGAHFDPRNGAAAQVRRQVLWCHLMALMACVLLPRARVRSLVFNLYPLRVQLSGLEATQIVLLHHDVCPACPVAGVMHDNLIAALVLLLLVQHEL